MEIKVEAGIQAGRSSCSSSCSRWIWFIEGRVVVV